MKLIIQLCKLITVSGVMFFVLFVALLLIIQENLADLTKFIKSIILKMRSAKQSELTAFKQKL